MEMVGNRCGAAAFHESKGAPFNAFFVEWANELGAIPPYFSHYPYRYPGRGVVPTLEHPE